MTQYATPNLTVDALNGTGYAYRRYGKAATVPVVFLQHFRGNLDNWDPAACRACRAGPPPAGSPAQRRPSRPPVSERPRRGA